MPTRTSRIEYHLFDGLRHLSTARTVSVNEGVGIDHKVKVLILLLAFRNIFEIKSMTPVPSPAAS